MFSKEELNNLGAFLNRVNLTGNEAMVLVQLQHKITQLLEPEPQNPPKGIKKEETKK